MKVTVLIAVHNGGDYLREAVDSVLAQTFADFELLLVDDGSTDHAIATLSDDPRVRVLRNDTNLGQVPSLNRGLEEARGEYVARLDADDVMLPTRLARQVEVLDSEPSVALVGTWMDVVDEHGRLYAKLRGHVRDYVEFLYAILVDRYPFGHPSLMFRRDVVRALGGYDATLAPSEDKDLYRRLALARHAALSVEEPLVRYRRHAAQLSQEQQELQLANDHMSQEKFLHTLAPAVDVPKLRLALAGNPMFWSRPPLDESAFPALALGAREYLQLSAVEVASLERLLRARAAELAVSAATRRRAAHGLALRTYAGADLTPGRLARARVLGLASPLIDAARPKLLRLAHGERVAPLRYRLARARPLRTLYEKVLGLRRT